MGTHSHMVAPERAIWFSAAHVMLGIVHYITMGVDSPGVELCGDSCDGEMKIDSWSQSKVLHDVEMHITVTTGQHRRSSEFTPL